MRQLTAIIAKEHILLVYFHYLLPTVEGKWWRAGIALVLAALAVPVRPADIRNLRF
jgi:hypothetical protein